MTSAHLSFYLPQVWNVQAGEGIANFRGHSGRVLSVAWSDLDPDIVYSGSEDFSLQAWSIAGQENKMPPKGLPYFVIFS